MQANIATSKMGIRQDLSVKEQPSEAGSQVLQLQTKLERKTVKTNKPEECLHYSHRRSQTECSSPKPTYAAVVAKSLPGTASVYGKSWYGNKPLPNVARYTQSNRQTDSPSLHETASSGPLDGTSTRHLSRSTLASNTSDAKPSTKSPSSTADRVSYREPRRARQQKRERSQSPGQFSGALIPAKIHANKTLLVALDDMEMPQVDPAMRQIIREERVKVYKYLKLQGLVQSATGWNLLKRTWASIEPCGEGGPNTNYLNTKIRIPDLREWENFPTFDEILAFSKSTPLLEYNFHELEIPITTFTGETQWGGPFADRPCEGPALNETSVVVRFGPFFKVLNRLISLATYNKGNEGSNYVLIGIGKCAMKRREGGNAKPKEPDLIAYWTNGRNAVAGPNERRELFDATKVPGLLVGDYKMVGKFDQSMLVEAVKARKHPEAQKVMNQIHDYMDMHHNRFGYIITEVEVVMVRRRNENEKWGQVDFSPAIPIQAVEGKVNALMVLWYFHVKYVVMNLEEGHQLPSFYHNCPKELGGCSYPVPKLKRGTGDNPRKLSDADIKGTKRNPKKSGLTVTSSKVGSTVGKR